MDENILSYEIDSRGSYKVMGTNRQPTCQEAINYLFSKGIEGIFVVALSIYECYATNENLENLKHIFLWHYTDERCPLCTQRPFEVTGSCPICGKTL